MTTFQKFHRDEQGAVTVDWVVLTAAIVGICLGVISIFGPGTGSSANFVSGVIVDTVDTLISSY